MKDKERCLGPEVLKGMWHREGICEALKIPGVNGMETGGIRSKEKSYLTLQKLVPSPLS